MLSVEISSVRNRTARTISSHFSSELIRLVGCSATPWASATFEGMRYILDITIEAGADAALTQALKATLSSGGWLPENQVVVDVCMRAIPSESHLEHRLIMEVLALMEA